MAVIRHGPSPEDHYSLTPNGLARDPALSLQAKGLYVYLRSHREGWEMSTERIGEALGIGRNTVSKYAAELEDAGYLVRENVHDERGLFSGVAYILNASPLHKNTDNGKMPHPVNAARGESVQHKKTNSFKKTKASKKNTTPNEFGADFGEFWEHYPRKIGKATAGEKYAEAREHASRDDLLMSVKNYAAECERTRIEKRYIPYPGTWLGQGRWRDFVDYAPKLSKKEKVDQALSWLEEI